MDGKNFWKTRIFNEGLRGWCQCNCRMKYVFGSWKDSELSWAGKRITKEGCSTMLDTEGKKKEGNES